MRDHMVVLEEVQRRLEEIGSELVKVLISEAIMRFLEHVSVIEVVVPGEFLCVG